MIGNSPTQVYATAPCGARPLSFYTGALLAFLIATLLSGLFPIISQGSRFALWGIWFLIWWLVIRSYRPAILMTLSWPALPLVVWFVVYGLWGAIVSPIPVFADVGRDFFRLVTIMIGIAALTTDRVSLRQLASMTTWVLFLNFFVSIALCVQLSTAQFLIQANLARADYQTLTDRYSGLWGNANVAGLDTLILLVLSAYGRGWLVWLARLAGVAIIFLTASRTATYLLLLIGLLFLYNYLRNKRFPRWIIVGGFVALAAVGLSGAILDLNAVIQEESTFSRVLDPLESKAKLAGGVTRLGLIDEWLPVLQRDPWCGQGYGAMGGGATLKEGVIIATLRNDLPTVGTHNMYLGTWIDAGFFGGISFLILLGFGLSAALRARLAPNDRTVVVALWMMAIVFSSAMHGFHASLDGQALYLLCFLLPRSIALRPAFASPERRRQPARGKGSL